MIKKPIVESDVKVSSKAIPKFKSEADERKFWEDAANDATEYFDASNMHIAKLINLKPSLKN
jgi:hypothetical protein